MRFSPAGRRRSRGRVDPRPYGPPARCCLCSACRSCRARRSERRSPARVRACDPSWAWASSSSLVVIVARQRCATNLSQQWQRRLVSRKRFRKTLMRCRAAQHNVDALSFRQDMGIPIRRYAGPFVALSPAWAGRGGRRRRPATLRQVSNTCRVQRPHRTPRTPLTPRTPGDGGGHPGVSIVGRALRVSSSDGGCGPPGRHLGFVARRPIGRTARTTDEVGPGSTSVPRPQRLRLGCRGFLGTPHPGVAATIELGRGELTGEASDRPEGAPTLLGLARRYAPSDVDAETGNGS